MNVLATALPDVLVIELAAFPDERGLFFESWHDERYAPVIGHRVFRQDSVSVSRRGVLRGLHYQHPNGQGKLLSVLRGAVFDVAADLRRGSPSFRRWVGEELSADNRRQLWIPPGFAHGFQALDDGVILHYKCTELYHPASYRCVRWDDPDIGIAWPLPGVLLSLRDAAAPRLRDMPDELLPVLREP